MTKICEVSGKTVITGNNVSHSNKKTKRRFLPNLQNVKLMSEVLGQFVKFRLSVHALRSIEFHGGLDSFLKKTSNAKLAPRALKVKQKIEKKIQENAA